MELKLKVGDQFPLMEAASSNGSDANRKCTVRLKVNRSVMEMMLSLKVEEIREGEGKRLLSVQATIGSVMVTTSQEKQVDYNSRRPTTGYRTKPSHMRD